MLDALVTDQFVADVEDEIGMGCGAWDMVNSKELCKAVILVYLREKELNGKEE